MKTIDGRVSPVHPNMQPLAGEEASATTSMHTINVARASQHFGSLMPSLSIRPVKPINSRSG